MGEVTTTIKVHVDSEDATAQIAEFAALMERSPAWLQWLLGEAIAGAPDEPFEVLDVGTEGFPAAGAFDVGVRVQVPKRFSLLLAALRAGNGQEDPSVVFE